MVAACVMYEVVPALVVRETVDALAQERYRQAQLLRTSAQATWRIPEAVLNPCIHSETKMPNRFIRILQCNG